MPSADLNSISIRGPVSKTLRTSIDAAIAIATAGTSQTSEMFQRRARTMRGAGRPPSPTGAAPAGGGTGVRGASSVSGVSAMAVHGRVAPDQPGIERPGRDHRQDDDTGEREQSQPGIDAREGAEAHRRREQDDDVDVEHRPVADGLDEAVKARAFEAAPMRLVADRPGEQSEHGDLEHRHGDAGDEHDDRQAPRAVEPELV